MGLVLTPILVLFPIPFRFLKFLVQKVGPKMLPLMGLPAMRAVELRGKTEIFTKKSTFFDFFRTIFNTILLKFSHT